MGGKRIPTTTRRRRKNNKKKKSEDARVNTIDVVAKRRTERKVEDETGDAEIPTPLIILEKERRKERECQKTQRLYL